jgi:hypothetical protein
MRKDDIPNSNSFYPASQRPRLLRDFKLANLKFAKPVETHEGIKIAWK